MSYGPDRAEPYRRGASMVDKILKGAKPSDIPVEQPTKFQFVVNLKARAWSTQQSQFVSRLEYLRFCQHHEMRTGRCE